MRLNLPGNTGKTPATYVSSFKKLGSTKSYSARFVEANDWRQSKETAKTRHAHKRAKNWNNKYGGLI